MFNSKVLDAVTNKVDLFELFCDCYVDNQAGYWYILMSLIPEATYLAMTKRREYTDFDFGPTEIRAIARMYERKAIRDIFDSQSMSETIEGIVYRDEDPMKIDIAAANMICDIYFKHVPNCVRMSADELVRAYEQENNIVLLRTTKLPVNCTNADASKNKEDAGKLRRLANSFLKAAKETKNKKLIQLASMYTATELSCRMEPKRINPDIVAAVGYRELIGTDRISVLISRCIYGYTDTINLSNAELEQIFNIYYIKNCKYNFGISAASYADPDTFKQLCGRK